MEEESIYNLIPKEYVPPPKETMYKSRYPPNLTPTGSTIINHTTSRPIANLNGEFELTKGPHKHVDLSSTFGKPIGSYKPSTIDFRKKQTGTMGSNQLPEIDTLSKFVYSCGSKKELVPKKDEKPIMGLQSKKNFIISNAVENILSAPKLMKEDVDWLKKKDFGQVPEYINKIKDNISTEYKMIQNMHFNEAQEQERQKYLMTEEEKKQLKDGLKSKWDAVNKEYQTITHMDNKQHTIGLKRKKEECERKLIQLEKDIEKLNSAYIFIDTNK